MAFEDAHGRLVAAVSGEILTAKISGEITPVEIQSGETIIAKVSGETLSIEVPTIVKTGPIRQVSGGSGGIVLHSGAVKSAVVKGLASNSGLVLVGGSGDRPWYEDICSGQGLILAGGEAASLDVDDFDAIYVVAEVSGDQVSFLGVF